MPRTTGSGISHLTHSVFPHESGLLQGSRGGALAGGAWGLLMAVVMGLLGVALLLPATAHARGRRVVPNLQQPWAGPEALRDPVTTIGLTVHVPTDDGMPLVTQRQVARWVERANQALRPHGIAVALHRTVSLSGFSEIGGRRDRRRLAAMAEHDGTIHVFVAENLDAQSFSTRRRVRGLHWRYHGLSRELRQREYVVVTLAAPQTTFAHEIGHLLGLRHSTAEDNIMCSCRRGSDTRFTSDQGAAMLAGAGQFISRQQQAQTRAQRHRSLDRARRRR